MKRRRAFSRRLSIALAVVIVGVGLAVHAFVIEPAWIEVTHLKVVAPAARPIRIAHLTDLHSRGFGRVERRLVALLEREKPDLIVITGDSVAGDGDVRGSDEVYARLHAPLGVYLVKGNWEHWRKWQASKATLGHLRVLENASARIHNGVYLLGFDDSLAGSADLAATLDGVPADAFRIGLFHSPEFFETVAPHVNLALAGHTHGGQVRLPGLAPLWLPPGSGPFVAGWYERGRSRLYVSRGIGSSVVPVRFLCRPELVIVSLGPWTDQ
jgi:uncharacterized protein